LLNGLLGYKDNHKNAAKVGEIETTLEPKSYRHPILNTVYLWDMPGVGTPRHPSKNYFERYFLGAFDAILIVFDDRLMASDVDIARQAKIYKVPVFFIKNKADMVSLLHYTCGRLYLFSLFFVCSP
jgi:predicted GTPase